MRIITNKSLLLNSINIVQKAVPSKTTLPILEGILFNAQKGKLTLTSTDLELSIETSIDVDVIEHGSVILPSRIIGEIARKLPDADVEIEKKDNYTYIKSDKSQFKIVELNKDEFPQLPSIDRDQGFSISCYTLKEMIKQTIFAVSNDEIRPILTGALMEVNNNKLTMVALDGFRMAVKYCEILNDNVIKAVIPGKTLQELNKLLNDSEDKVNVYISKNQILFQIENTKVISRLLEGEFINYNQLIPNEYKIKLKVDKEELLNSCERAALFARDSNNTIKFEIFDKIMNIKSNSETGNVHEEVLITKEGEDLDIAFNPRYFIEALRVINTKDITIELTTNVSPSIIKTVKDESFLYLVLPVRRR